MSLGSFDREQIRGLERRALRAWPALQTLSNDGWVQRFSGGYTKRANSINALEPQAQFNQSVKNELEAAYIERGLPPIWRLSPLAPPDTDAALAAAGYRRIDETMIQVAPLDARFTADPEVRFTNQPSDAWLAGFAELSPVAPTHHATMERMLKSIAVPVGFASVEEDGQPIAFALGVVEDGYVGLFDVLVAPRARRRGLARRLTQSVGAWGRSQGARHSYLQVVASNEAAVPLYAELGYRTVYPYAYRVP